MHEVLKKYYKSHNIINMSHIRKCYPLVLSIMCGRYNMIQNLFIQYLLPNTKTRIVIQ